LLLALIGFLIYTLYSIIKEPIAFQDAKNSRKNIVVDRLKDIRTSQELYRDITGKFASDFDTLVQVLKTDSLRFEKIEGDPDDPTNADLFKRTVYFESAFDSIVNLGINLDSLRYVPLAEPGTEFSIKADTMTYQKTLVNVCEVSTRWNTFMGKYANPKYAKYDNLYDPNALLKFGDMNSPNITGNWER
jgi:hypothetical protein